MQRRFPGFIFTFVLLILGYFLYSARDPDVFALMKTGKMDEFRRVITANTSLAHRKNRLNQSILFVACCDDNKAAVEILLEFGANPFESCVYGFSSTQKSEMNCLEVAQYLGHIEIQRTIASHWENREKKSK